MFDRHLLGDVAVAVLLAVPATALARPATLTEFSQSGVSHHDSQVITAEDRPVSLLR
jgi:hypothetical protein